MTEEQKVARREYKRRWRQNNPEKCKEYQERFWTKKAEEQNGKKCGRQSTASKKEQEERAAEGRTQGRKGCRVGRFNIGFITDNRDYIEVMSRVRGESMTDFINYVITEHRKEHGEAYEQAKEIIKDVEGVAI